MDSKSDNVWTGRNGAVGAAAGGAAGFLGTVGTAALIGSSLGPWGMIAGAAIGAIVGGVSALIATEAAGAQAEAEAAATNNVIQYVQKNGNDIFAAKDAKEFGEMLEKADLKIDDTDLIESLYANKEALQELTAVEVAKLNQEYADWQNAYAAYNMGNTAYTGADSQTYLNNVGYQTAHDQATIDQITSDVQGLWDGMNEDFWQAYLTEVLHDTNVNSKGEGDNYRV
jgi:gas vesicle protein